MKKLIRWLKYHYYDYCMSARWQADNSDEHYRWLLIRYIPWQIQISIINPLICKIVDHDIECDDWGGPDSGGVAGHCTRCNWGYRHVMY